MLVITMKLSLGEMGYSQEFDEELDPPRRLDSVLIYSDSDLDDSFIDWGEIISTGTIEF